MMAWLVLMCVVEASATTWPEDWDTSWSEDALDAFHDVVGTPAILGLGEHVHTSGGIMESRTELVKHLVEHDGYRLIAFESPWSLARTTTQYTRTCEGSALEAGTGLYGVFQDLSVIELLSWICRWNSTHPGDEVLVVGFDVQGPGGDMEVLQEAGLRSADIELWCSPDAYHPVDGDDAARCVGALQAIEPPNAPTTLAVRSLVAYHRMRGASPRAAYTIRDAAMAANLRHLVELHGNAKTVVWAHNGHLSRVADASLTAGQPMGSHLEGEDYAAVAFISAETGIAWRAEFRQPRRNRLARQLVARGATIPVVDPLRGPRWWFPRQFGLMWIQPARAFDAVVALQHSRPMFRMDRFLALADDRIRNKGMHICFLERHYASWDIPRLRALTERAASAAGFVVDENLIESPDLGRWHVDYERDAGAEAWCAIFEYAPP